MSYPAVFDNSELPEKELSRAKARFVLNAVARRHSISGSVITLSKDLGFSERALHVAIFRLRMSKRIWEKLSPLMSEAEQKAFRKEMELPE